MRISYHATFLNVTAGFYLGVTSVYGLIPNHLGLIALTGLLAIGGIALLADLFIQRSIRNRKRQNKIGLCIALLIAIGLLTL